MNKKHTQILLLITVISLWGIIIYKAYNFLYNPESEIVSNSFARPAKQAQEETDTLRLLLNYGDPFGIQKTQTYPVINTSIKLNPKNPRKTEPPVLPVSIPALNYQGLIYNPKKSVNVGIVSSKKESLLLKQGDTVEGWVVKELRKDSLSISHKNQVVWIRKK